MVYIASVLCSGLALLTPLTVLADGALTLYGRVSSLENTPENAGRSCRIGGVVSHVSGIRPGLIVLVKADAPYRGGIPVRIPDGVALPHVGDEIIVDGVTESIAGRMGIAAASIAKVNAREPDFLTELRRHVDLREGRLTYRRVSLIGAIGSVGFEPAGDDGAMRDFSVIAVRFGAKTVHVRAPGRMASRDMAGRVVRVVGCVFPVIGSAGDRISYCIEVETADDIEFLDKRDESNLPMALMSVLCAAGLVALAAALAALVRSRRERLKLEAVAAERRRMASDLHDTIEQNLAGVKLLLTATRDVPGVPGKARDIIERAERMLVHAKGEVRTAVMNLRGDGDSSSGLEAQLRDTVRSLSGTGRVKVRTFLRGIDEELDAESRNDVLLIVREAIANALKHANASRIAVVSDPCDGGFVIRVANDGDPFDPARAPGAAAGHFGLEGMRRRAQRHGFDLSFATEKAWTVVRLEVRP